MREYSSIIEEMTNLTANDEKAYLALADFLGKLGIPVYKILIRYQAKALMRTYIYVDTEVS